MTQAVTKTPEVHPPKVPLAQAQTDFARICQAIDEAEDLDDVLIQTFQERQLARVDAVDRRVLVDGHFKREIAGTRETIKYLRGYLKALEENHEKFKERTKDLIEVMKADPDMPPLPKGELGSLTIAKSGTSVDLEVKPSSFSCSNTLSPEQVKMYEIPEKFLRRREVIELDTKAVKAGLEAGEEYPWARLKDNGTHLRVNRKKGKSQDIEAT